MYTDRKSSRKLFLISMFGFLISSASVFAVALIPENEKGLSRAGMMTGILFWMGIFWGVLFFALSWNAVRNDGEYQKLKRKMKPGCISFGKTRGGLIADCLALLFLIIVIVGNLVIQFPDIIMMFCIFIWIYSFCLHFMLNGRVYRYLSNYQQVKEGEKNER